MRKSTKHFNQKHAPARHSSNASSMEEHDMQQEQLVALVPLCSEDGSGRSTDLIVFMSVRVQDMPSIGTLAQLGHGASSDSQDQYMCCVRWSLLRQIQHFKKILGREQRAEMYVPS